MTAIDFHEPRTRSDSMDRPPLMAPPERRSALRQQAGLVISLDFELMWGLRDLANAGIYRRNVLGVRQAIPATLELFKKYDIHATWAAVGLLLFDTKAELEKYLPSVRPSYQRHSLSPYPALPEIGDNERSDPLHYGLSLAAKIVESDGQELASHTFCHYYCLEPGQTLQEFEADTEAAVRAVRRVADSPRSLVFPRNQYNSEYLACFRKHGLDVFRGNERHWAYSASSGDGNTRLKRLVRMLDSYGNISGQNGILAGLANECVNLPSSRFLRPFSQRLRRLNGLRVERITRAMRQSFMANRGFHLWWHPHNFGANLDANLFSLEAILRAYVDLRDRYDAPSLTMAEYADAVVDCNAT